MELDDDEAKSASTLFLLLQKLGEERNDPLFPRDETAPYSEDSMCDLNALLLHVESQLATKAADRKTTTLRKHTSQYAESFLSKMASSFSLSLHSQLLKRTPEVNRMPEDCEAVRFDTNEAEEDQPLDGFKLYDDLKWWDGINTVAAQHPPWNRYVSWVAINGGNSKRIEQPVSHRNEGSSLVMQKTGEIEAGNEAFSSGVEMLRKRKAMGSLEAAAAVQQIEEQSIERNVHRLSNEEKRNMSVGSGLKEITRRVLGSKENTSFFTNEDATEAKLLAYKEIIGGEIREDILAWVLSMKLSPGERVEEDSIAGLRRVKKLITDKLVNPILRPELHIGLHQAPKGILLFGPPGTGKTMLAKWMATASGATFFEVTPSAVISKYHGETETLIRTLYKVAEVDSPSIIFVDEIDSLLGKRSDKEDDSTIRMKNQLLQMMDGVSSKSKEMVVLVGATNRPDMLDEAALRRLSKRVLVPLPDEEAREKQIQRLLATSSTGGCQVSQGELRCIAKKIEGWNGSDIKSLCAKAAEYSYDETIERYGGIVNVPSRDAFRDITFSDLEKALHEVHSSSSLSSLEFEEWAQQYGAL